jgi:hypothetical protein
VIVAMILLVGSSCAFASAFYFASDWNWAPAVLPLPGPGLEVQVRFEITTSGKFRLQATVPTASPTTAIEDLPTVPCRLEMSVARPDSPAGRSIAITSFHSIGRGEFDLYAADPELTLSRGEYVLTLRNLGPSAPFSDKGVMLELTRFFHPTEFYLQGVLLRGLGWFGLVSGVIVAACAAMRSSERQRSGGRG